MLIGYPVDHLALRDRVEVSASHTGDCQSDAIIDQRPLTQAIASGKFGSGLLRLEFVRSNASLEFAFRDDLPQSVDRDLTCDGSCKAIKSPDLAPLIPKLRIAFVSGFGFGESQTRLNDSERFAQRLADQLRRRGHDVILFDSDNCPGSLPRDSSEVAQRGQVTHSLKDQSQRATIEQLAYDRVMQKIADGNFDIVHNNSIHPAPLLWANRLNCPLVTTLHMPPVRRLKTAVLRNGRTRCGRFVHGSQANSNFWWPLLGHQPVIHEGVNLSELPFEAEGGIRRAFWLGPICPNEGVHLAIDAAHRAGLPIHVAGPIEDSDYFRWQIQPRLRNGDQYFGNLTRDEEVSLLQQSSVRLVTPCRDDWSATGVLESLACGTPVAGFARGTLPEIVTPHVAALTRTGNVVGLARAITACQKLSRLGCRRWIESRFSLRRMVEQYESFFYLNHLGAYQ